MLCRSGVEHVVFIRLRAALLSGLAGVWSGGEARCPAARLASGATTYVRCLSLSRARHTHSLARTHTVRDTHTRSHAPSRTHSRALHNLRALTRDRTLCHSRSLVRTYACPRTRLMFFVLFLFDLPVGRVLVSSSPMCQVCRELR